MNLIFGIKSFTNYLVKSKPASGYGIHSPFVFRFATEVVLPVKERKIMLPEIEKLRKQLSTDNRNIFVEDLGTGKSGNRKVKNILSRSSSSDKVCRLLFQIAKEFKPVSIIELGTNLGLSAASMALANSEMQVVTIEGSQALAQLATENFEKIVLKNISIITGEFEVQLAQAVQLIKKPFIAFIDGNHSYSATIQYFNEIAKITDNESLIIIDDIHKSEEMQKAWEEICRFQNVTTTIDLFQLGIVTFRHGLPKAHHNILF
jgi:predicted O-methyltransferase YrrM